MEYLEGMLQKEKDNFSRVCNRLLGTCFLCKGNQNTKADYYFVLKYRKEFKNPRQIISFSNTLRYASNVQSLVLKLNPWLFKTVGSIKDASTT